MNGRELPTMELTMTILSTERRSGSATLAARALAWLAGPIGFWANRVDRRGLVALDDRTLRDIGLTRGDVEREYLGSPWQAPDWQTLAEIRSRARRR